QDVRIVDLLPGLVETGMLRDHLAHQYDVYTAAVPLGRPAAPEAIAETVAAAAGEAASGLRGVSIAVDGGWTQKGWQRLGRGWAPGRAGRWGFSPRPGSVAPLLAPPARPPARPGRGPRVDPAGRGGDRAGRGVGPAGRTGARKPGRRAFSRRRRAAREETRWT